MFNRLNLFPIVAFSLLSLLGSPILWAQTGDLEAEAALAGKQEAPPPSEEKQDPDPKLAKRVEVERKTTELRLNRLQTAAQDFADIEESVNRASQLMLGAMNTFFMKHGNTLSEYRMAAAAGEEKKMKKLGKAVIKIRKTFLKSLKKANRILDKLKKLEAKLMKQAAEEVEDDAKDKPVEEKPVGTEAKPGEADEADE